MRCARRRRMHWICCCSDAELQWSKKEFVADYQLICETGKIEHLLSDGRAKEILAEFRRSTFRTPPSLEEIAR